ncbi:DUF3822 family protein [Algoriphagus sp. H41]|uniref:DUF3822 family protein n=1 Tax=Algoriphagus oliviformis TaxID=2811231 RepID=A0ABS3C7U7_9BACT|nr:DUF3822 family protein [Algoriphagus oliviformis]MBN7813188.1 DUF3822 family protein [Algoriphagus oliviformis]
MENNLKVYKSDKFDVEDTAGLSLFLYPHSLFIFAKDKNQANIGVHHYQNFDLSQLEGLFGSDPLLRNDVPAKFYFHQAGFSLVPGVLFQPGQEREYLQFAKELPTEAHFFSTPLDSNNLQVVGFISAKLRKDLDARFSEVTLYHGCCSFLSYLFKERFNLIGQEILVNYFGSHIYLAAFTDQDLGIFNFFEIAGPEDILKYVLIAIEQLGYERNHVRVSLFGATEKSGISEAWGKEYFQNFRLVNPHSNQNYSHGFKHLKSENVLESYWQYE